MARQQDCDTCIYDGGDPECTTCIDNGTTYSNYTPNAKTKAAIKLGEKLLLTDGEIDQLVKSAHRKVAMYMYMVDAIPRMREGIVEELERINNERAE